jgi:predicted nuclease of predicted toxin-antitoxin system
MKIKLDNDLSPDLQRSLSELGHDVDTVGAEGLSAADDSVIAAAARENGRMLFGLDHWIGDLRDNPPGTHPGVVRFRVKIPSCLSSGFSS